MLPADVWRYLIPANSWHVSRISNDKYILANTNARNDGKYKRMSSIYRSDIGTLMCEISGAKTKSL